MKKKSKGEILFYAQVEQAGLPLPEMEYRFHPRRKWKFDFAWSTLWLAVEVEGGVRKYGRHNRAKGFIEDCNKYNEATIMGWRVLRYPTEQVMDGTALAGVRRILDLKETE